jgi:hypothetical protein
LGNARGGGSNPYEPKSHRILDPKSKKPKS